MARVFHTLRGAAAIVSLAVCLFGGNVSQAAVSGEAERTALETLRTLTAKLETVACDFTQETDIPLFAAPVRSEGVLRFKKPDRLIWEYRSPLREGFVLNGSTGYRWEDDKSKRAVFSAAKDPLAGLIARQMLAWIRFDQEWIRSEYAIRVESSAPLVLTLTPAHAEVRSVLQSLRIAFADSGVAESVTLTETGGGVTTIRFRNVAVNAPLDEREFQ